MNKKVISVVAALLTSPGARAVATRPRAWPAADRVCLIEMLDRRGAVAHRGSGVLTDPRTLATAHHVIARAAADIHKVRLKGVFGRLDLGVSGIAALPAARPDLAVVNLPLDLPIRGELRVPTDERQWAAARREAKRPGDARVWWQR